MPGPWDTNRAYRASAFIALSALIALSVAPCHAEKVYDFEAGFVYDSNLPRAPEGDDKASDTAATARLSGGWRGALGERSSWSATAFARGAKFVRFDGLDTASIGVAVSASTKFGLGAYVPWARAAATAAQESYNESGRNGVRTTAELRTGKRFTEALELSGGARYDHFRASHTEGRVPGYSGDVWSGSGRSVFARADYSFDERWLVYADASLRHGDFVSSTRPDPEILEYASAVRRDPAFGPDYVAYRLQGRTQAFALGVNRALGPHSSLDFSVARAVARTDSDIQYATSQAFVTYVYSY